MLSINKYILENTDSAKVVYKSDKDYELFLEKIKLLPEDTRQKLIKLYMKKRVKGIVPSTNFLIEK